MLLGNISLATYPLETRCNIIYYLLIIYSIIITKTNHNIIKTYSYSQYYCLYIYVTWSLFARMMIINRRFCFKTPLNNVYFDKTIFKVSVILLNHIGNYFTFFTIYDALIGLYMNIAHKKDVKKRRNMSSWVIHS